VGLKQDSELSSLDKPRARDTWEDQEVDRNVSFKNSEHKNGSKSPNSWVGREVTKRRKRNRRNVMKTYVNTM
jgi:hypothetical protein